MNGYEKLKRQDDGVRPIKIDFPGSKRTKNVKPLIHLSGQGRNRRPPQVDGLQGQGRRGDIHEHQGQASHRLNPLPVLATEA